MLVPVLLGLAAAWSLAPTPVPVGAQSDPGAEGFATHCASCHQADGAGIPGTFPPLTGNPAAGDPAHVADVIQNGMSGPIEVDGVAYDSVMPAVAALQGAELDAVVAYVVGLAGGSADPAPGDGTTTDSTLPSAPTVGDPDRGRDLFLGSRRLDGGGAACAACHVAGAEGNLGGSSLGPDLTTAFTRLGGEAGLTGWLGNPPSPTMAPIFADRPMTPEDIADLVAFLATTPDTPADDPAIDGLLVAGVVGVVVLFGGMAIAWRGMRQTYRERLTGPRGNR